MTVLRKDEDDWWFAKHEDGRTGSIPVPYVEIVSEGGGGGRTVGWYHCVLCIQKGGEQSGLYLPVCLSVCLRWRTTHCPSMLEQPWTESVPTTPPLSPSR